MIKIKATATVIYNCTLTDKDEITVRKYAEENGLSIEEAINEIYCEETDIELDIYTISSDSDFITEEIEVVSEKSDFVTENFDKLSELI